MVWVSSAHGFRCGSVLVLMVFGQRHVVGKQCLRVSVRIGDGSHGLLAALCCVLAVVRGFWCGSGGGYLCILVWVICGSTAEVWVLVWIGCGSMMEVCDFSLGRRWVGG